MSGRWLAGRASLRPVRHLWKFLEPLSTWFLIFRLGAKKDPTMSGCSLKRVTRFCARRGWRNCMITLLICGSMLTSVTFGREHILLGFDSLVLSGPDIPSGCFDLLIPDLRITGSCIHSNFELRTIRVVTLCSPPIRTPALKRQLRLRTMRYDAIGYPLPADKELAAFFEACHQFLRIEMNCPSQSKGWESPGPYTAKWQGPSLFSSKIMPV